MTFPPHRDRPRWPRPSPPPTPPPAPTARPSSPRGRTSPSATGTRGRRTGKADHANDYETVGFAIEGEATVTIDGRETRLTPGVSWLVPKGAKHHYAVPNHFKAVEATSPPARG